MDYYFILWSVYIYIISVRNNINERVINGNINIVIYDIVMEGDKMV